MVEGPNDNHGDRGGSDLDGPQRGGFFSGRRSLRSPGESLQPDLAPPPPPAAARKRRPVVATASGIFSFLGIAAIMLIALFSFALQKLTAPGPLQADKVVYIEAGTDTAGIIGELEHEGVIDSWPLMTGALYLRGDRHNIKAGEYQFKQGVSVNAVIDQLVGGKQIMHSITIPEGLTTEQVVQRLMDDDILVGTVRTAPKEGTLMPDTYKFARGFKREQLIGLMQAEMKKVSDEVWSHRTPETPIKSPYEMRTLASIVEKETGKADERPRVAGVFINRLTRNIPLQSDPTIVYGLVGGKGTLGRGILKSELEQKTPYNTYTIVGLPPGPICNPGRAAMEAVANPSRTKDMYFVADGTGGHAFAETLDQHRANVLHWRQIEKDAKDKLPPESDKLLQISPTGAPPPKLNQRGELPSLPMFGALDVYMTFTRQAAAAPTMHDLDPADYPLSLMEEDHALSKLRPMLPAAPAESPPPGDGDDLAAIPGVETQPPVGSAEERALAGGDGQDLTFPVSPARRADERARAAQFGLAPGSDTLPPQAELVSADPAATVVRGAPPGGKGRILDASEGTRLDPLLNKTYDLNSPKTVPNFAMGSGTPASH